MYFLTFVFVSNYKVLQYFVEKHQYLLVNLLQHYSPCELFPEVYSKPGVDNRQSTPPRDKFGLQKIIIRGKLKKLIVHNIVQTFIYTILDFEKI